MAVIKTVDGSGEVRRFNWVLGKSIRAFGEGPARDAGTVNYDDLTEEELGKLNEVEAIILAKIGAESDGDKTLAEEITARAEELEAAKVVAEPEPLLEK